MKAQKEVMPIPTLLTLIALLLTPATATAATCQTTTCAERVARKHCSQAHVLSCVKRAALHHHQDYTAAKRVSFCESGWNPFASNGTHFGVWQFLSSTWATTPYDSHSVWSAKWSSLAAMWMWRVGRRGEWACT